MDQELIGELETYLSHREMKTNIVAFLWIYGNLFHFILLAPYKVALNR